MSEDTNKDKMPDFIPPAPSEANGWHCWHECNQHRNTLGVREFVCCDCGGSATYAFRRDKTLQPINHGPYYPTKVLDTGEWKFEIASSTRYVCEEGKAAAEGRK